MAEARDRLVRPVDLGNVFAQRRQRVLSILQDEPESTSLQLRSPLGRVDAPVTPRVQTRVAGGGVGSGTPRSGIAHGRRNAFGSASVTRRRMGRENTPVGSFRRKRSVLPSWYPRTPLRDITAVVRAIERRRAHLGEVAGPQMESPMSLSWRVDDSSVPLTGDAQQEHDISMMTPIPSSRVKQYRSSVGKVPKILLDITNQVGAELESLTPQKKLLNSIDKVEKVVMEELNKLKRTPTAKKAEREKRVRTLLSMR